MLHYGGRREERWLSYASGASRTTWCTMCARLRRSRDTAFDGAEGRSPIGQRQRERTDRNSDLPGKTMLTASFREAEAMGTQTMVNPTLHSPEVRDFERGLLKRVVGQERA